MVCLFGGPQIGADWMPFGPLSGDRFYLFFFTVLRACLPPLSSSNLELLAPEREHVSDFLGYPFPTPRPPPTSDPGLTIFCGFLYLSLLLLCRRRSPTCISFSDMILLGLCHLIPIHRTIPLSSPRFTIRPYLSNANIARFALIDSFSCTHFCAPRL